LSFVFIIIVQHLIFIKKQKVEFLLDKKSLLINENRFDFDRKDFSIKIYEPKKWILKPILYNRSHRKLRNCNRSIEFSKHDKIVTISKLTFLPDELIKLIDNYHNSEVLKRNFNWMK